MIFFDDKFFFIRSKMRTLITFFSRFTKRIFHNNPPYIKYHHLKHEQTPVDRDDKEFKQYATQFTLKNAKLFKDDRQVISRYDMEKYLAEKYNYNRNFS